ncbi:hypothetical protein RMATCC62417_17246 [Rhizopus microsporus]|nr:hypothetical protein RMATCC62417_17246 [Rhizopus microsporus]
METVKSSRTFETKAAIKEPAHERSRSQPSQPPLFNRHQRTVGDGLHRQCWLFVHAEIDRRWCVCCFSAFQAYRSQESFKSRNFQTNNGLSPQNEEQTSRNPSAEASSTLAAPISQHTAVGIDATSSNKNKTVDVIASYMMMQESDHVVYQDTTIGTKIKH